MKRERMFGRKDCTTANELLDELDPARGHLWQRNRDSLFSDRAWIFRGVWDATKPLRPSAWGTQLTAPQKASCPLPDPPPQAGEGTEGVRSGRVELPQS